MLRIGGPTATGVVLVPTGREWRDTGARLSIGGSGLPGGVAVAPMTGGVNRIPLGAMLVIAVNVGGVRVKVQGLTSLHPW